MSIYLKGQIFYSQTNDFEDVQFYKVVRSTTNTCEVCKMRKVIIFQNDDIQYVEPDLKSEGLKMRCKVLSELEIQLKTGEKASNWDGKPVRQIALIFMPVF